MRIMFKVAMLAASGLGLLACGSGGGGGTGQPADIAAAANAGDLPVAAVDPGNGYVPPAGGGEGCQFDKAKQGKIVGKEVKNFGLKTYLNENYFLHDNNCGKKKIVWILLATGW